MNAQGNIALWLAGMLHMLSAADPNGEAPTTVGMEGVYYLRYQGPAIEARAVDDRAPIVLRIADVVADRGARIYELRYIGARAGGYDLMRYLKRVDGGRIEGVSPIRVTVREILPADHSGVLDNVASVQSPDPWRYQAWLTAAGGLWLAGLIVYALRAAARRRRTAPPPAATEPADDPLRRLVEAAAAGRLTPADRARLELLLIAEWRGRLDLTGCTTAEALGRIAAHPEAGKLMRQLEAWLHERPGTAPVDVAAIVEPYRGMT